MLASIIRHRVLANVVMVILIIVGVACYGRMVREFFPETSVDIVMVSVLLPGGDPEEIEEGISRKIEEAIDGTEGVKKYITVSSESYSRAIIEVKPSHDLTVVKEKIKTAIDAISNFPEDAEKPVINDIAIEREVLRVAVWGNLPEKALKELSEQLKDEVLELPEVSRVDIEGTRDYEIGIEVSEVRLREYGLTFGQVADAVRRSSLNLAGGTIRTEGEQIRIRTIGRKYLGGEFAQIVVAARPDGTIITLNELASVRDDFVEDPVRASFNGKPCATLLIKKVSEEDAINIAQAVRGWVTERENSLPEGVNLTAWYDTSLLVQERINLLAKNGVMGLVLVFVLLWLFLDLRLSFWVAMGIPLCFCGAFGLMYLLGATLNMISLFSLILVLGIIVDDAIVVGEAIYVHRKNGDPPLAAAINGVKEVGIPVVGAVVTTMIAFLPLLFVPGVLGKFISILPVVVISTLSISLLESLFLLPAHLNHLPDITEEAHSGRGIVRYIRGIRWSISTFFDWFINRVYSPFVSIALTWRYVTMAASLFIVMACLGLIQGGFLKFEVFPTVDGNLIEAKVEFPDGTPIAVTQRAIEDTEAALYRLADKVETQSGDPLIENVFAVVGQAPSESGTGVDRNITAQNVGYIQVELLSTEKRGIHFEDLNVMWNKEVGPIPGALSQSFSGEEQGPPGAPISVGLRGQHLEELLVIRDELKERLRAYEGVYQVDDDFRLGKNELQLRLKDEARTMGLTVEDLARQVYAGYFGEEALRLQRGRDDIRVRVRYTEQERSEFSDIENVRIRTPRGDEVPLFSVADVYYTKGPSTITRSDGLRQITVTAEVNAKQANAGEILAELSADFFPQIAERYPSFTYRYEGPQTESRDAFGGLLIGFPIALLGIFVIIATIFRSYIQPVIIMLSVPYGLVGASLGHMLLGYPLTMMSVFGMVALAGVVVNDSIVLIECFNNLLAKGVPFLEALRRAGLRRFRAIFLTTATTVGGLAPLITERSMQAQFLVPMAISLAAGVAFATLQTLVLVPCMLAILNDLRRLFHYGLHDEWLAAEDVEPAKTRLYDPAETVDPMHEPQDAFSPADPETAVAQ